MTEQPARHTVDTITSDALDALYEMLDAAQETELARQLATADKAFLSAHLRATRNGAALDRTRRAHASTIEQAQHWHRVAGDLRKYLDDARARIEQLDSEALRDVGTMTSLAERADRAEATIARVRAACTAMDAVANAAFGAPVSDYDKAIARAVTLIRTSLEPQEATP